MKKEILEAELGKIIDISKEFGIEKVLLFGSCLEDVETAQDIDIAVSGINPRDFFKYYGKVSMVVDDEVDIFDLDDLREHLCKRILSKGKVLYEKGV
ncbi:MAG TPA: nucleotidyltransferase family protein [Candidatus Brocadiia bacterium]|nr:nucleotidyltransferase domain-containing protein [Planctomycetota bacterium]MBI4007659.1 nucleotidyltransferase domain-containing protein [Planctomycetota bacterium]MDO8093240.1 nucleotidyltransferase domain-containing protein [Candidatus Brocadiales bacterium]